MRRALTILIMLSVLALVPIAAQQVATKPAAQPAPAAATQKPEAAATAPAAPRPMELADIIAWKNIGATAFSNDGKWFAYRLSPTEGDSEVVVKATDSDKVYKFPVGEMPSAGGGRAPADLEKVARLRRRSSFSPDSKWVAFTVYPTRAERPTAAAPAPSRQAKVQLLDLASGKDVTIENIRRFAFAGERGGWVAIAKAPATSGGPGAGAAPRLGTWRCTGSARPAAGAASDRPKGTDLILRELATGRDLDIGNVSEFAFDKRGRFLAWSSTRRTRPATACRCATWRPASSGRWTTTGRLLADVVERKGRGPGGAEGH